MTTEQLQSQGFTCTDPDTNQWVKKVADWSYEVYEAEHLQFVDLQDYDEHEIASVLRGFYNGGLWGLLQQYPDPENWKQIIAECIAETVVE